MDITLEREVLVTLISDEDKLKEVLPILKPAHISSPHLRWTIKKLFRYHGTYNELPPRQFFLREVKKDKRLEDDDKERYTKLLRKLFKKKISKGFKQHTIDELKAFVDKRELAQIIEKGLDHLERDDVDRTISTLAAANKVKSYQTEFTLCDWLEDFNERQYDRKKRKDNPALSNFIRTPWNGLNTVIGGLQPGEAMAIASLTNVGKSIALMLCGKHAVINQDRVVHFTIENSLWQTNQRYDSSMLNVPYDKFKFFKFSKKELRELKEMIRQTKKLFGSNLITAKLIPRRASIVVIERVIEKLKVDKGFIPKLIIIDSADQMIPAMRQEQYRLDQSEVYWDIKAFADAHEMPVLTSTHVSKTWKGKKAAAEALAEAYDKARILDIVLTLNQLDDASPELLMLVAKNRDGKRNVEIPIITEYGNMVMREKI